MLLQPAADAPPRPRSARLTPRGRLVIVAVALLLALAAFGAGRASAAGPQAPSRVEHVTVAPGESLWTVARRVAPDADPRDTVGRIAELNSLAGPTVHAGQRLAVPRRE